MEADGSCTVAGVTGLGGRRWVVTLWLGVGPRGGRASVVAYSVLTTLTGRPRVATLHQCGHLRGHPPSVHNPSIRVVGSEWSGKKAEP